MPRVIAIETRADLEGAVKTAVAALRSGAMVGLPGSTSYGAAVLADNLSGIEQLKKVGNGVRLAVTGEAQAMDLAPDLPERLTRLLSRCWPGPLEVRVPVQDGGFQSLPGDVQAAMLTDGLVPLIAPGDPVFREVLASMDQLLAVSGDFGPRGRFDTAFDLVEAFPDVDVVLDAGPATYNVPGSVVQVTDSDFEIVFSGILSEQALSLSACQIYLFVCTGNTCRSPLAEGLFRNLLAERLQCEADDLVNRGYLVQSAGLAASSGSPASAESVDILTRRGVDITSHSSQPLSEQLLEASDHIFTMTSGHREAILRFRADLAAKVQVLHRDGGDVVDPIGGGMSEYERCEREIEQGLRAIIASHFDKGL